MARIAAHQGAQTMAIPATFLPSSKNGTDVRMHMATAHQKRVFRNTATEWNAPPRKSMNTIAA